MNRCSSNSPLKRGLGGFVEMNKLSLFEFENPPCPPFPKGGDMECLVFAGALR